MLNKISIAVAALVVLLTVCVLFFSSGEQMTEEESPVLSSEQLEGNAYVRAYSPVLGATDGPVTIVEFFDYACGYCKKVHATVDQLLAEDKKVRLIFKEYPILGQASLEMSQVAVAVSRCIATNGISGRRRMLRSSQRL